MADDEKARSLRDYGLTNPTKVGVPKILHPMMNGERCPHCKGATLFMIQVDVEHPMLKGGKGIGTYTGCAACPWASPMLSAARP